ncbi:innexin shaking-B [Nephila pilipes]|uniref:Innexin n=1 Tax=Nephila pilipes TaxID=299642 RepID=A0A8X6TUW1_NEPPI|nr:innexin shaking-B [Nephila pilipes]
MFNFIQSVGTVVQIEETRNDYEIFRLHYICTVGLFLIFFIVLTITQFVGHPISCEVTSSETIASINTFCWIHPPYVIPKAFEKQVGKEIAHPGLDDTKDPTQFYYIRYYQWVYFMHFLQAFFFYLPRWLWITWEGGKMKTLTRDFNNLLLPEKELNKKVSALSRYLVKSWSTHSAYVGQYFFCELLSLINVMGQFFILDTFFDGKFYDFGVKIVDFYTSHNYIHGANQTQDIMGNPMIMLFPRMTKCLFRKYGESSTIEVRDILCVMSLNVINEKFYVFLWFWFVILAILTTSSLVMNLFLIISASIRVCALRARFSHIHKRDLQTIAKMGTFSDWFMVDMIGRNIDHVIFKDLITDVAKELTHNKNA